MFLTILTPALRFNRLRTCYGKLKNISGRQALYHIRPRSTYCLNNAHLQFCSRVNHFLDRLSVIPTRSLTYCSRRKGKRKTVKAVIRRFRRTGSGKWKRWQAGKNHFNSKKRYKRRARLRRYVICNKQQTKLLNKMVNGW